MGVAAYNRGSVVAARQLRDNDRPVEFEIMDNMNAIPKDADAVTPLGPCRLGPGHGGWWLYCPVTGYGFWYRTIGYAMRRWNIMLTGYDGEWTAIPVQRDGNQSTVGLHR